MAGKKSGELFSVINFQQASLLSLIYNLIMKYLPVTVSVLKCPFIIARQHSLIVIFWPLLTTFHYNLANNVIFK